MKEIIFMRSFLIMTTFSDVEKDKIDEIVANFQNLISELPPDIVGVKSIHTICRPKSRLKFEFQMKLKPLLIFVIFEGIMYLQDPGPALTSPNWFITNFNGVISNISLTLHNCSIWWFGRWNSISLTLFWSKIDTKRCKWTLKFEMKSWETIFIFC